MAHIENCSRMQAKVKNRDDLARHVAHNHAEAAQPYCVTLRDQQLKPFVALLDEAYMVRYYVHGKRKGFTAASATEAEAIQKRIEADQYTGLFVDYTQAHQTSFADLLIRYLKEEAPRKKGFAVIEYQINMWLEDAGYERQDLAATHLTPTGLAKRLDGRTCQGAWRPPADCRQSTSRPTTPASRTEGLKPC
ncbi:hypothetical protein OOZ63_05800 [Paucibacter sp. PLA-PC-4]|uniref:hypothetical protein n=1 Tax=Paucibacter sp. PLA-PC-4 TaxID=2993655 RepID=UPI002248D4E8|nr:hypothetical protein [Paucibacter sp. PLA-PC-4]MCX2861349.1 hypothetical protein [Paucibacter sp. PLA-PC-4]